MERAVWKQGIFHLQRGTVDIVYLKRLILISTVGTLIIPAGTEHHGRSKRNQLDP